MKQRPSSHSPHPQHKALQWVQFVGGCVLCLCYRAQNNDSQGVSQMASFYCPVLFPSFACGLRPSPDSGQSSIPGFGFNMNDLWLRQPRQEFTQTSRNRDICLIPHWTWKNPSHHIPELSNGTEQNTHEPEWPLGDHICPRQGGNSCTQCGGWSPPRGAMCTCLHPQLPQLRQAVLPFRDKAETVTSEGGPGADS